MSAETVPILGGCVTPESAPNAELVQIGIFMVGLAGGGLVTGLIQLFYLTCPMCCCRRLPKQGHARAWATAGVVLWFLSVGFLVLMGLAAQHMADQTDEDEALLRNIWASVQDQ